MHILAKTRDHIINKLKPRNDTALVDAARIYKVLMRQARLPEFYGPTKVPDNYDGRIDLLTLHIAIVLKNLRRYDISGQRLSQSIFDVMRDDFEIALREEGLSDAGIKRRIKPMMQLFFTRIKTYVEGLENNSDFEAIFTSGILTPPEMQPDADNAQNIGLETRQAFAIALSNYTLKFSSELMGKSLGEIAMTEFLCPKLY